MEGDPAFVKITPRVAGAIGTKVTMDAVMLCVQRGGDPEILLDGGEAEKPEPAAPPPPEADLPDADERPPADEELADAAARHAENPPEEGAPPADGLDDMTVAQLRAEAKNVRAPHSAGMSKSEMIAAIRAAKGA